MSVARLIVSEIRFRTVNFLLCLIAVIVAAVLFIVGPTLIGGYADDTHRELAMLDAEAGQLQAEMEQHQRETQSLLAAMDKQTKRIMRDLGVNLRVVHKDTNLGNLYTDFVAVDFPEEYVQKLATSPQIETIVHLIATLQEKVKWRDRTALVVGTLPVSTVAQIGENKEHMAVAVEPGCVFVGHELGAGLKADQTIEIEGQPFKIAQIMPEYGGLQDVQLVLDLHDAQRILNKPGRINQIMALGCKCKGDRISAIREQLATVLPDTVINEDVPRAEAREKQRDLVEATRKTEQDRVATALAQVVANRQRQEAGRARQQHLLGSLVGIATPLAVLVSGVFVGLMTGMNVRERRAEIGVLRALGKSAGTVAGLFLGKAFVLGLAGGLIGCGLGFVLAPLAGHAMLDLTADLFTVRPTLLIATVVCAPVVTVLASYWPTWMAVRQDPALVLMDN